MRPAISSSSRPRLVLTNVLTAPILVLLALSIPATARATAADPSMSAAPALEDRAELLALLDRAEAETLEMALSTPVDRWNTQPAEGRWSVGDVVQHLVLAERGLLAKVRKMAQGTAHADWRNLDVPSVAALTELISDRSKKAQAPEGFHPKETWSREQAIQAFLTTRQQTRTYVLETDDPLETVVAPSPFGSDLTATRFLAVIGAHNLRHNGQIREVLATR